MVKKKNKKNFNTKNICNDGKKKKIQRKKKKSEEGEGNSN